METITLSQTRGSPVIVAIAELLPALNELHHINRTTVLRVRQRTVRGEEGRYVFPKPRIHVPAEIWISKHARHPRLTLLHEMGHFLDNQCLHPLQQLFCTETDDSDFIALALAWRNSDGFQRLANIATHRSLTRGERAYLHDATSFREMWARSYAQWAANRLAETILTEELNAQIRRNAFLAGIPYSLQWENDDFHDIMHEIESLLKTKGLL